MKIVIVGAGSVGLHLARSLSWDGHAVTIIEQRQDLIDQAQSSMDVLAVRGNATSIRVLLDAGVQDSDLVLAVTNVDEVNIVSCMLARELGVPKRIARVRNQEYSRPGTPVSLAALGIDQVIHPELEAAHEVVRLIRYPDALDIVECADSRILLVGIRLTAESPIIGRALKDLTPTGEDLNFRLVGINRGGTTIIPTGSQTLAAHDIVYAICKAGNIDSVFALTGRVSPPARNIMLLGGGIIGRMVAEQLEVEKDRHLKLIESDAARSAMAAQRLHATMVVRGKSGIDIDLLTIEGIEDMDIFAALTEDDENNIVTSLFARHLKVGRTITLISKPQYMPIVQAIGLDAAINERLLTTDAILKHLRGGRIINVSSLRGIRSEIVEYRIGERSKAAGRRLRNIDFPEGVLVGAIDRQGEIEVAVGDSIVQAGDRVVVFTQEKHLSRIEKIFA